MLAGISQPAQVRRSCSTIHAITDWLTKCIVIAISLTGRLGIGWLAAHPLVDVILILICPLLPIFTTGWTIPHTGENVVYSQ